MVAQRIKNTLADSGDTDSVPRFRKIPWSRKCDLLQNSCRQNSTDRGAWQATVHEVAKSQI